MGAGDCFVGTFAYLLAECLDGDSFAREEEVDFETICGFAQKSCFASSYSVQFEGGFDKYPSSIINHWK